MAGAQRVHADDTGWRVGGKPAQLMGFTTETATVYQIRDRHRNQEVREGIPAGFAAQVTDLRQRLDEQLQARALPDSENQRLLEQLGWHHNRGNLLRFLEDRRVDPKYNRAERYLRPAVIARKVSQCSKTQAGADAFAAFTSVLRTAVQQGGSGTEHLTQLRCVPTAAPLINYPETKPPSRQPASTA